MKRLIIPLFVLLLASCSNDAKNSNSETISDQETSSGSKPTKQDIDAAMHKQFDLPGDNLSPKHDVEIHDIKIGDTEATNEQDRIDGIPEKADVTMVKVDFTERSYYTDKTTTRRREITAKAFKDDFGEWKVLTDASREISSNDEPAKAE